MNNTYATFIDPKNAERAAGALLDHGVKVEHLSIVFPEGYRTTLHNDVRDGQNLERQANNGISTTTPADASSGAVKGAGIGLVAGTLAALAAVFIPGIGLVIGGGALALAIGGVAGTTAAGAVAGGVTGYLKDQGVPDEAVHHAQTTLVEGGALLSVNVIDEKIDDRTIMQILEKYDGKTIVRPLSSTTSAVVMDRESGDRLHPVM